MLPLASDTPACPGVGPPVSASAASERRGRVRRPRRAATEPKPGEPGFFGSGRGFRRQHPLVVRASAPGRPAGQGHRPTTSRATIRWGAQPRRRGEVGSPRRWTRARMDRSAPCSPHVPRSVLTLPARPYRTAPRSRLTPRTTAPHGETLARTPTAQPARSGVRVSTTRATPARARMRSKRSLSRSAQRARVGAVECGSTPCIASVRDIERNGAQ